jgi:hypothetical protein
MLNKEKDACEPKLEFLPFVAKHQQLETASLLAPLIAPTMKMSDMSDE